MADNNFDCAATTDLFCNEETTALCFDDDDDDLDLVQSFNHPIYQSNGGKQVTFFSNDGSDSEAFISSLPCLTEECIGLMVEREKEYLPRHDYISRFRNGDLDVGLRRESLDWMFKACAHFSFGELCLYSAMTYFDRFLSSYESPLSSLQKGGQNWAVELIAVACLSIAAKLEEVHVPSALDLQAGVPNLFEAKTVQRMEIMMLSSLKWKIKAYTPCNFIDYYLRKMNYNKIPSENTITRSLQIILSTIQGIEFLEFRPSEIAAAVAMYVSGEIQAIDIDKALSFLIGVEKERVVKCLEMVRELPSIDRTNTVFAIATAAAATTDGVSNVVSSLLPHSPNGVLEAACLSYKRDEKSVESCPSSSHTSPDTKRRKLDQTATVGGGDS